MPTRPKTAPSNFHFKFWKEIRGKGFYDVTYVCDKADLKTAIAACSAPEELMRSRMGQSFHYLDDALEGNPLDRWGIAMIESGLAPMSESDRRYFPSRQRSSGGT